MILTYRTVRGTYGRAVTGSASGAASASGRTSVQLRTSPAAPMPASTQNASAYPEVKAAPGERPALSRWSARLRLLLGTVAVPQAPPICCDVVRRPDATPARRGGTPASAAIETAM